ncbi:MAG: hypothetical protein ABR927_16905 [Bacteroidales bacterium]|jgi:hypothetical protein
MMIKSDKKIKELKEILNKDNNIAITEAIELLRQEKPFEGAIGLLTAFYDKTDDFSIRKTIAGFMNDLKDQAICREVIEQIRKQWKSDTISMLVSSCWQSGLNYSDFSLDMAKVFLKGDYITAIECLTVIEESVQELSMVKKDEIIKMLEESPISQITEKKELAHELILILKR